MHAIPFLAFLSLRYQVIAYHHLVVKDHVLVGHAFQTIRTSDWLSCLQACSADPRCASYNVNKHKSCELNDSGIEDKCDPNESLIHSDGAIFQQLRKVHICRKLVGSFIVSTVRRNQESYQFTESEKYVHDFSICSVQKPWWWERKV